jgi:hypothetical protein
MTLKVSGVIFANLENGTWIFGEAEFLPHTGLPRCQKVGSMSYSLMAVAVFQSKLTLECCYSVTLSLTQ